MSLNLSSESTDSTPQTLSRPSTPPYFDAIIRTDTVQNTGNSKRKRLTTQYICKQCPSWSSSHRVNTVAHVLSRHALSASSQLSHTSQSSQPVITSMFRTATDQNIIRNAFNQQGYRDALVGLRTRRRVPFSSIEWAEMRDLALACNPLDWWCPPEQRQRYPRLSNMAISILSIPAESSEPERTFSGARRTCSWDRSRLTCNNIEKIECIGSWLREGHIKPLSSNEMGLPMEPQPEDDTDAMDDDVADLLEWI